MADDDSPNNGEMHYTTSEINRNDNWQSICNTTNSSVNGYSSEDRSNSPLDFSFKRKNVDNEISGSESIPSPASTNDTGIHLEDRTDSDERLNGVPDKIKLEHGSDQRPNWSLNHNVASMISAFQAGLIPNPMLGPMPSVAALMNPRFSQNKSSSTRPLASYPKDPLAMGAYGIPGFSPSHIDSSALQNLSMSSEDIFSLYRQHMLLGVDKRSESSTPQSKPSPITTTTSSSSSSSTISPNEARIGPTQLLGVSSSTERRNYTASRKRPRILPDEQKDESYWERRRKNNDAAKRSRDLRRAKEDEIAIRAALLEQENLKLRVEVAALKTETAKLRCMLYNS